MVVGHIWPCVRLAPLDVARPRPVAGWATPRADPGLVLAPGAGKAFIYFQF